MKLQQILRERSQMLERKPKMVQLCYRRNKQNKLKKTKRVKTMMKMKKVMTMRKKRILLKRRKRKEVR
jgi:hypothetical protein